MRFVFVINTIRAKALCETAKVYCDHWRMKRFKVLLWFFRLSKFLTFQVNECHQTGRTKGRTFDYHYKPFIGMVPSEDDTQPVFVLEVFYMDSLL